MTILKVVPDNTAQVVTVTVQANDGTMLTLTVSNVSDLEAQLRKYEQFCSDALTLQKLVGAQGTSDGIAKPQNVNTPAT